MASSSASSSYAKLSIGNDNPCKCIWFDTAFTKCQIATSKIAKLEHILELYDDITALVLVVDCPLSDWKITRPLDGIKHLYLDARAKFCDRPDVLPENIWLMFPNLETLITKNVFLPVDNLNTLQNLNAFRLIHGASKIKKQDNKIQEIVQILANMTTLIDLQIISEHPCQIPDELFQNNPGLKYIDFYSKAVCNNIPSIANCRELCWMGIKIDILANPYILELSGLCQVYIMDHDNDEPIPDEIFAKPVFTSARISSLLQVVYENVLRINASGPNYLAHVRQNKNVAHSPRTIADGNFVVGPLPHW